MGNNIKTQIGNIIGNTLNSYHSKVKPIIDDLKFRQEYQDRIIECMVGEVDDNYIETPEINEPIVKLEHSKEGLVKIPSIKGKTILVDADGNETDTPAEGCRLVSVGEDEDNKLIILSKNKNLFSNDYWELGFIGDSSGNFTNDFGYIRTTYIKIKPSTTYRFKGYTRRVYFYDKNKEFISFSAIGGGTFNLQNNTFTTPNNCSFIALRYDFKHANSKVSSLEQIKQIETIIAEGMEDVTYIEHKSNKTEILLNEPLRSLPNGVCDEIVGNKIIRRVGKVTWGKSENGATSHKEDYAWGGSRDTETHYIIGICVRNHSWVVYTEESSIAKKYVICDKLQPCAITSFDVGGSNQRGYLLMKLPKEEIEGSCTTTKIKEWLDKNVPTLIYPLAEPIIEELPNRITTQGFDDTTMYIENSITPTVTYGYNALIPYKEELSNQKEEVEANALDIENNIIPYLMDMEFNLMTMEDK